MAEFKMKEIYYLTRSGLKSLIEKQKQLIEDLEKSTRAMGASASLDNDLRENPEFMHLRTKITYELPEKIKATQHVIHYCKLINETEYIQKNDFHEIMPGMEVHLIPVNGGEVRIHSILGYEEGNPLKGIISYLSPVGQKLLHLSIGDEVELPLQGKLMTYEITNISRSPFLD